ncbi:hypothetical protein [Aeromicrobium sp. CTD01-1L150]|uniref:hypothetical protein n=1 Tax=Aeromicrobium sp. CTD01-1L150 TaxID=3341830 RepID=UPI0035C0EEAE
MIRSVASGLLWIVAVAAITVTLPVAWVALNVADEDGFVELTAPFATDDELGDALSAGVADAVVETTGLPVGQQLLRELVDRAFTRLVDDPQFPEAWRESQRASHRATFEDGEQERLVLDIGPIVDLVGDEIADDLPVALPSPETIVVPVTREVQPRAIEAVRAAPSQAALGGAVAVLASLGSVLLARRRSVALGFWGLGVVGAGGVLMLAANRAVPDLLATRAADSELAATMRDLLAARATAAFEEWLLVTVVVGGVAMLVGFGSRIVRR